MGVWGSGLYSGDFALDLRCTFKALTRLPFDGERLLQLLCDLEPKTANHPDDEDHTTFWLSRRISSRSTASGAIERGKELSKSLTAAATSPCLRNLRWIPQAFENARSC